MLIHPSMHRRGAATKLPRDSPSPAPSAETEFFIRFGHCGPRAGNIKLMVLPPEKAPGAGAHQQSNPAQRRAWVWGVHLNQEKCARRGKVVGLSLELRAGWSPWPWSHPTREGRWRHSGRFHPAWSGTGRGARTRSSRSPGRRCAGPRSLRGRRRSWPWRFRRCQDHFRPDSRRRFRGCLVSCCRLCGDGAPGAQRRWVRRGGPGGPGRAGPRGRRTNEAPSLSSSRPRDRLRGVGTGPAAGDHHGLHGVR